MFSWRQQGQEGESLAMHEPIQGLGIQARGSEPDLSQAASLSPSTESGTRRAEPLGAAGEAWQWIKDGLGLLILLIGALSTLVLPAYAVYRMVNWVFRL